MGENKAERRLLGRPLWLKSRQAYQYLITEGIGQLMRVPGIFTDSQDLRISSDEENTGDDIIRR